MLKSIAGQVAPAVKSSLFILGGDRVRPRQLSAAVSHAFEEFANMKGITLAIYRRIASQAGAALLGQTVYREADDALWQELVTQNSIDFGAGHSAETANLQYNRNAASLNFTPDLLISNRLQAGKLWARFIGLPCPNIDQKLLKRVLEKVYGDLSDLVSLYIDWVT